MNDNRQMGMHHHYIDSSYPYTVTTQSFMNQNFYDGLSHMPMSYAHAGPMTDQVVLIPFAFYVVKLPSFI